MKIKDWFIFSTSRLSKKDYFISLVTSELYCLAHTFIVKVEEARSFLSLQA